LFQNPHHNSNSYFSSLPLVDLCLYFSVIGRSLSVRICHWSISVFPSLLLVDFHQCTFQGRLSKPFLGELAAFCLHSWGQNRRCKVSVDAHWKNSTQVIFFTWCKRLCFSRGYVHFRAGKGNLPTATGQFISLDTTFNIHHQLITTDKIL
jgi:hypothetical protein